MSSDSSLQGTPDTQAPKAQLQPQHGAEDSMEMSGQTRQIRASIIEKTTDEDVGKQFTLTKAVALLSSNKSASNRGSSSEIETGV